MVLRVQVDVSLEDFSERSQHSLKGMPVHGHARARSRCNNVGRSRFVAEQGQLAEVVASGVFLDFLSLLALSEDLGGRSLSLNQEK